MRLLLVEDSRDLAAWLPKVLRADGYAVDVAIDGEEAGELLSSRRLISDCRNCTV